MIQNFPESHAEGKEKPKSWCQAEKELACEEESSHEPGISSDNLSGQTTARH